MKNIVLALILVLGACTTDIGANQYSSSSVGSVNRTEIGTVISVRQIQVRDDDRSGGTMIGGLAGGLAGSQIGSGSTAGILGAVGGALLGGAAGNMAQKGLSGQGGYEYVVRLDNGSTVTLTQGTDVLMAVGQRCMILYGGGSARGRLIPYNG